jgi:hypothetical protein
LRELQVEMIDRFGLLPEPAKNLFRIAGYKQQRARSACARSTSARRRLGHVRARHARRAGDADPLRAAALAHARLEGGTQIALHAETGEGRAAFRCSRAVARGSAETCCYTAPMKPPKKSSSLVVLALALLTLTASAQQSTQVLQSYDVELLDLSHAQPERPRPRNGAWKLPKQASDSRFRKTSPSRSRAARLRRQRRRASGTGAGRFKLTGSTDTLRRSRNYQPLAHFGWTQPGYARNDAKLLTINSLVPAGSGIVGQVALTRGRYLHLTLDLVYDARARPASRRSVSCCARAGGCAATSGTISIRRSSASSRS